MHVGQRKEFAAEINIHFSGLKNLDKPSVLVFPRILVCLDCGFSRFTAPEAALELLAADNPTKSNREQDQNRATPIATKGVAITK
jgi:hypothetical protein